MPYKKKAIPGTGQFNKYLNYKKTERILKHKLNLDMIF